MTNRPDSPYENQNRMRLEVARARTTCRNCGERKAAHLAIPGTGPDPVCPDRGSQWTALDTNPGDAQ